MRVYLHHESSASFAAARNDGFAPRLTAELSAALNADAENQAALVAMLIPDHLIGPTYRDLIARAPGPVTLVLAHGYAVYAGDLEKLAPGHAAALLAPKAIGPKLSAAYRAARPGHHGLVAAFNASAARQTDVRRLAGLMGFAPERLVPATFEQEAIGDLISEQTLLCGGVFNLIDWTFQAMREAGVPEALIREECLTELELVAGLIRERGPAATLGRISQAAQCGTVSMRERLIKAGVPQAVNEAARDVINRDFVAVMNRSDWRARVAELRATLESCGTGTTPPEEGPKQGQQQGLQQGQPR